MNQQELEDFRRAMLETRFNRISSQERARDFLREEGLINSDGSLTAPYASTDHPA